MTISAAKEIREILAINAEAVRLEREKVVNCLKALTRKDVGTFDEGDGHLCDYSDESKDGRFVEWDDIQKVIDGLSP